jgi:hypothetical protein
MTVWLRVWVCCCSPWVYFTNILRTVFICADPKSAKKTDSLIVFFALLGSLSIKDVQVHTHLKLIKMLQLKYSEELILKLKKDEITESKFRF